MPDNILFLMTDQHSVSTIGAYGHQVVPTPALDRLAATGTRFADAFTPTAICTPRTSSNDVDGRGGRVDYDVTLSSFESRVSLTTGSMAPKSRP